MEQINTRPSANGCLKVAVVGGFPPNASGEANYTGCVFRALASLHGALQITVFAHRSAEVMTDGDPEKTSDNLTVHRITNPETRLGRHFCFVPLLRSLLRLRPDVVHFQGTHTKLYGGLFGEGATLVLLALRLCRIPTVLTVHSTWTPADLDQLWRNKRFPKALGWALTRYYLLHTRLFVWLTGAINILCSGEGSPETEKFRRNYRVPDAKLYEEPHPCAAAPEIGQPTAKQRLGLQGGRVVLACGFVRPDKGYHLLLDAVHRIKPRFADLQVVVCGEPRGPDGATYARSLMDHPAVREWPGHVTVRPEYVSDEELDLLTAAADIVVVPYLRAVGASGPIHRALGFGKVVVASEAGHNAGLAAVCRTFPVGDAEALAECLAALLGRSAEYEKWKASAVRFARRHSWRAMAQTYLRSYQKLLAGSMAFLYDPTHSDTVNEHPQTSVHQY